MKKRSNLISFKLSEDELDFLESQKRTEDESLSLVAKRIIEESTGKALPKTTIEEKVDAVLDLLRSLPAELGKVNAQ